MSLRPTDVQVSLQTGTDRTLFATWNWSKSNTDKYDISWKYDTGDGVWFVGNSGTSDVRQSTYSAPSNAINVAFKVRAVSKKKGKNGVYWKCDWSKTVKYSLTSINLTDPGAPNVSLVGYKLTATIDDYTAGDATAIEFQLVSNNTNIVSTPQPIALLNTTHAAFTWPSLEPGNVYKVRCRAVKTKTVTKKNYETWTLTGYNSKNKAVYNKKQKVITGTTTKVVTDYGTWSSYSENVFTGFGPVEEITSIETYSAYGSTGGVRITWKPVLNFDSSADSSDEYEIEYADDEALFDTGDVQSSGEHKQPTAIITGLDLNKTYYFRVRAKAGTNNGSIGDWSPIASMAVGTVPGPPTIWSYLDTIELGEDIILNWVHSSDDGSKQTEATITVSIGDTTYSIVVSGETSTLTIHTDTQSRWNETFEGNIPYPENDYIFNWKVKTKGIIDEYGEDSGEKSINVYESVILNAQLYRDSDWLWDPFTFATDTIYTAVGIFSYPIDDVTKYPVEIGLTVTPVTQNAISYSVTISAIDGYDTLDATGAQVHISAGDIIYTGYFNSDPENPNELNIKLLPGDIDLENNQSYMLNASVAMDSGLSDDYSTQFNVAFDVEDYEVEAEITVDLVEYSAAITPICRDEYGNTITNVYFNVYRREYNGSFVTIESYLDGEDATTIIDPHPSLDYARYRIVAISKITGSISYSDIPGYEIGLDSIVIQWDETWSNFDTDDSEELDVQPKEGSMLLLPYNIDVSISNAPDVALINYIGNENPTSYYGTQRGETGSWNCEIPISDKETLYGIRRLANYMGNVYIREPSGIGYWAQVNVSYSLIHTKTTVPITFNITRVEGGT